MSLSIFSCKSPITAGILLEILIFDIKVTGFIDRFRGKLESAKVKHVWCAHPEKQSCGDF